MARDKRSLIETIAPYQILKRVASGQDPAPFQGLARNKAGKAMGPKVPRTGPGRISPAANPAGNWASGLKEKLCSTSKP
jgi:hypothetical protein